MATTFATSNGWKVDVRSDPIEVTSLGPRPDPKWVYTDNAGHTHDAKRTLLKWEQDDPDEPEFWFDADGDEHNADSHLECRLCGEWIVPGTIGPSGFREYIPGPMYGTATDPEGNRYDLTAADIAQVRGKGLTWEQVVARIAELVTSR